MKRVSKYGLHLDCAFHDYLFPERTRRRMNEAVDTTFHVIQPSRIWHALTATGRA